MELIKDIIKQFYPILILCSCLFFAISIFFTAREETAGVFGNAGAVFVPMMGDDDLKNDGLSYIGAVSDSYIPLIKYNSGAKEIGDCVKFKSLFLVQKKDGNSVDGSVEDDFAIYLTDIKNQTGNSVLMNMTSEEIAGLEEVPAAFIYDKEQDELHIFCSGNYTVCLKVYGSAGGCQQYEFRLPVEAS